jgi:hypothetical protein
MARVDFEYLISLIILVIQREEEEEKNTYRPESTDRRETKQEVVLRVL